MPPPLVTLAVCGPTASGKSELSLDIAVALGAEVVNVDSVQVYRGLDIGSAKVPPAGRRGVPHHLLDVFEPDRPANVAQFRELALGAVRDISARGRLPLLVGGSGMYFTVLLHGLADVPQASAEVRAAVAALAPDEMHRELMQADPAAAARLHPGDLQRVSRALEIVRMSGSRPSELMAGHGFASADVVSLVLVLCRPRAELYGRINQRSAKMLEEGLLKEAGDLLQRYGPVSPLATLGYKQACQALAGSLPEAGLAAEIALHTRRFAKRQMTYWRNEPPKRGWGVRPSEQEQAEEVSGVEAVAGRGRSSAKGFRALRLPLPELISAVRARLAAGLERTEVWYVTPPA